MLKATKYSIVLTLALLFTTISQWSNAGEQNLTSDSLGKVISESCLVDVAAVNSDIFGITKRENHSKDIIQLACSSSCQNRCANVILSCMKSGSDRSTCESRGHSCLASCGC